MTKEMIQRIVVPVFNEIKDYIKNDSELNELVRKDYWISGSSTFVYPYQVWLYENKPYCKLEIQLSTTDKRKSNKLINHLKKMFNIPNLEYQLNYNDGSCPWELTIYYNLS